MIVSPYLASLHTQVVCTADKRQVEVKHAKEKLLVRNSSAWNPTYYFQYF